jgi:non-ribosomal peptide synthetase component F
MTEAGSLSARIEALQRADKAIANAARSHDLAALLEAIEARIPIAAAVLEEIAREDRDLSSRMAAAGVRPGMGARFAERAIQRDREMEALARLIDTSTREYNRLLRQLEDEQP